VYIYNLLWQYWWSNYEHNYEFTTRKTHKEGTQNVNLSLSMSNLSIGETCVVELSHHGILSWNTFKMASRRFHPLLCRPLLIFHETGCKMLTNHKAKSIGKEFQKDVGCLDFQHSIFCKMDHCTTFIWNNIFDDRIWCFGSGLLMYIDFWRNKFFSQFDISASTQCTQPQENLEPKWGC
jgi:hypothetical protein